MISFRCQSYSALNRVVWCGTLVMAALLRHLRAYFPCKPNTLRALPILPAYFLCTAGNCFLHRYSPPRSTGFSPAFMGFAVLMRQAEQPNASWNVRIAEWL